MSKRVLVAMFNFILLNAICELCYKSTFELVIKIKFVTLHHYNNIDSSNNSNSMYHPIFNDTNYMYELTVGRVFGMLLTPPDIISQTLLAIPMWLLFEIGILFGRLVRSEKEPAQH